MWELETDKPAADIRRITIHSQGETLRFGDIIRLWREDAAFRSFWVDTLRDVPFEAYCWETPPLTRGSVGRPFECVFVDNPALAATGADPTPFAEHFDADPDSPILTFDNLGGDALLVVPSPKTNPYVYSHLAVFARQAPEDQAKGLWPAVADAVDERLDERPLWLSTAGLGVYWLHVRLDERPKYYRYRPYARHGC